MGNMYIGQQSGYALSLSPRKAILFDGVDSGKDSTSKEIWHRLEHLHDLTA